MSGWDGSGTYTRAYDWTNERDASNNIDATKFDAENDAFAAGINNCIAKDGQNAATGDLPMGGNKHTGVADGSALTHYSTVKQTQGGSLSGGTTGGSANAQTLTLSPAPSSYPGSMVVKFTAGFTNTGATTLNINGLGAQNVKLNGDALIGGEIVANRSYIVVVNGTLSPTEFDLIGPMPDSNMLTSCIVQRTTNQSVAGVATAAIEYTGTEYDPHGLFSLGTPHRITLSKVGLWIVSCNVTLSAAGDSNRIALIRNGITTYAAQDSSWRKFGATGGVYASAVTDYVEAYFSNATASSVDVNPVRMTAAFVG